MITKEKLIEEGYEPGNDITKSVYILNDGTLWDGGFDMGSRGVEHREVEAFTNYNRYHGTDFWDEVLIDKGLVMVIPESKEILFHPRRQLSIDQSRKILAAEKLGFELKEFK